jgi:transposase-like protein
MHRNAPLTPEGRLRLCNLIEDGWPVAAAAESMRISRQTAHKWWRRYQDAGVAVRPPPRSTGYSSATG